MNEFQERYKSFNNRKLLKIVEEPENYQSMAVEAARLELAKREISDEEIQSVIKEISEGKAKDEVKQQRIKKVENKAKELGVELFQTISPIQNEPQTTDRKINLIAIVFGLIAACLLLSEIGLIESILTDGFYGWDLSPVLYFTPIILLPVATFLFWKRNKTGWAMLCAICIYNIVNALAMLSLILRRNQKDIKSDYSSGDIYIEFHEIENLFPQPNPITYVAILLFFGGSLWTISRTDIRSIFKVDGQFAWITIGLSALLSFILIFLI